MSVVTSRLVCTSSVLIPKKIQSNSDNWKLIMNFLFNTIRFITSEKESAKMPKRTF